MDLLDKIKQFTKLNVLVIGDIILDRYLYGNIKRISPEAPVPVVHLNDSDNRLGGAANVALNLKELGASVDIIGIIGDDQYGLDTLSLLAENNINSDNIIRSTDRPTTVKSRILSQGQQVLRVDSEKCIPLDKKSNDLLIDKLSKNIKDYDLCIIQDYEKGLLNKNNINSIIEICNSNDVYIAVDPKKENFWEYNKVDLFKPNINELESALNLDLSTQEKLELAIDELKERLDHKLTVLTLSDKGIFVDNKNTNKIIPTIKNSVFDVSGAGDTVISIFSLCVNVGIDPFEAASVSNIGANIVCQKLGVRPIKIKELAEGIEEYL